MHPSMFNNVGPSKGDVTGCCGCMAAAALLALGAALALGYVAAAWF